MISFLLITRRRKLPTLVLGSTLPFHNNRSNTEKGKNNAIASSNAATMNKLVMISDLISCDGSFFHKLRSKKKRSLRLIACFICAFLGSLALFSSYERIHEEDEYSREIRLSRGKSSTMVVSIMHVDYGMLATAPEFVVIPSEADESIAPVLENCCGLPHDHGNVTMEANSTIISLKPQDNNNLLGECDPTAQIRVTLSSPFWTIQALDQNGRLKRVGGDEFFVVYSSPTRTNFLVAKVLDRDNGNYHLDFVEPPLSKGIPVEEEDNILTVHLLYTCGMGRFAPPLKKGWKTSGAVMKVYEYDGLENDGLSGKSVRIPPPPLYRRPWTEGLELAEAEEDERGLKVARAKHSNLRKIDEMINVDRLDADNIVFFGDENTLAIGRAAAELVPTSSSSQKVLFGNHSVQLTFGNLPEMHYLLDEWHGSTLRFPDSRSVALVIGTSLFDLALEQQEDHPTDGAKMVELDKFLPLGSDQVDHLTACESFIRMIREEYPEVHLYWRLPIPVPIHKILMSCPLVSGTNSTRCNETLDYLSYFRMQQMYQAQKQLMEELDVHVLDLFDAYYVSPELYNIESGLFSPELHKRAIQPFIS